MKKGYTKPDSKEIKELFKEYSNNPTKNLEKN